MVPKVTQTDLSSGIEHAWARYELRILTTEQGSRYEDDQLDPGAGYKNNRVIVHYILCLCGCCGWVTAAT